MLKRLSWGVCGNSNRDAKEYVHLVLPKETWKLPASRW